VTVASWTDIVGVTTSGNSITKTGNAGWNAGAASVASLAGDGFATFSTSEYSYKMAGLTHAVTDSSYDTIDFALYTLGDGSIEIWEGGSPVNGQQSFGTYAPGDTFTLQVSGNAVTYLQNGALLYTSTRSATLPLVFDASMYTPGATVTNVSMTAVPIWQNVVGVTAVGPNVTKTGANGWNAGASTVAALAGDGYAAFTTGETTTHKMVGLTHSVADNGYATIDFGVFLAAGGAAYIFEDGIEVAGPLAGGYAVGDVFQVQVTKGIVTYLKNGTVFYTSTQTPTSPLVFDAALYSIGATIENVIFTGSSAWQNIAGVTVTNSSLTKTAANGWNSGASSVWTLNGPGYVEFTTAETSTDKLAGLTHTITDNGYATIDFGFFLAGNSWETYEDGALSGYTTQHTFVPGDVFRIDVAANKTVTYSINGKVVISSNKTASFPLVFDASLYSQGATVTGITLATIPGWQNATGVLISGANLTKTSAVGWNAGASLATSLAGDGNVTFTTGETSTSKLAGLTHAVADNGYATIDFGIFLAAPAAIGILENGAQVGPSFGTYAAGDVFKVMVHQGGITYWQNGTLLYTSTRTATAPLYFDASLYSQGATIKNVVLTSTPPFWQNVVGSTYAGASLTKIAADGWNAGASSATSLTNTLTGDGFCEFTTGEIHTYKMAGLTHTVADSGYATIDFGIFLDSAGGVNVYEDGVQANGSPLGSYAAGDVFRVQATSGVVTYLKNGTLLYTSTRTPSYPLVLDVSLYSQGATIQNAVISPLATPTAESRILSSNGRTQCAIMNGGAWCWGYNGYGQLGNGTTTASTVPVQVSGLTSGVTDISVGNAETCALQNGAAWCWGTNSEGGLGNPFVTNGQSFVPVPVQGLNGAAQLITAGGTHACALVNGGVWCWGANDLGQLGDGGKEGSTSAPVQVVGLSSGVQTVSAGFEHTCASANGGVQCWGYNAFGALGTGQNNLEESNVPVQVAGLTSGAGVQAIATAGSSATCAIVNGGAWCWPMGNATTPTEVPGLTSNVQAISPGGCAAWNGSVQCWGSGYDGSAPIQTLPGLTSGVETVSGSCAVMAGNVYCWTPNTSPYGMPTPPAQVPGLSGL
jgi:hypothetical protein